MTNPHLLSYGVALVCLAIGYALRSMLAKRSAEVLEAYHRGRGDAMKDWTIVVEPYREHNEGWFKDRIALGYRMQLSYQGFPVGEPTLRIVDVHEKLDKERVEQVLQLAERAATEIVGQLVARKMNAKIGGRR